MASTGERPPTSTCLTGWARSFDLGPDDAHIMRTLQIRFGLKAQEARDKLQGLRRERRTPSQDRASSIERLAQTAFSQVEEDKKRRLVYNAFFRTINSLGLQC